LWGGESPDSNLITLANWPLCRPWCVVYPKLFDKIYAPLTAGLLKPFPADARLPRDKIAQLDKVYLAVTQALANLLEGLGLKAT
jgi:hypothetical protein